MGSASTRLLPAAAALLASAACGGAPAAAPPPRAAESAESTAATDPETAKAPPRAPKPSCTDSSCFPCGGGFCPSGFYCDEGVSGGAACSWLPTCAASATCECVTKTLPACRCSTEGGGAHVKCD